MKNWLVVFVVVAGLALVGCAAPDYPGAPTPPPAAAQVGPGQAGPAAPAARVRDQWCVVSGEGTDLLHVWGPFATKEEADAWAASAPPPAPWRVAGITAPGVR